MSVVALIPARGGSRRIPRKNIRLLDGHPLIAYSIAAAKHSGIFTDVVAVVDDDETHDLAERYGATVYHRDEMPSQNRDVQWLSLMFNRTEDAYAILRPTSPFRTSSTIQRAWAEFQRQQPCDSLRAVEPVKQHPGKMWVLKESLLPGGKSDNPALGSAFQRWRLYPLLPFSLPIERQGNDDLDVPWHSSPTQALPVLYVQNASLEIGWTYNIKQPSLTVAGTYAQQFSIAGDVIAPFLTTGYEGFDINTAEDWQKAETLTGYLPNLETGEGRNVEQQRQADTERHAAYAARGFTYDPAADPDRVYGKPPLTYTC